MQSWEYRISFPLSTSQWHVCVRTLGGEVEKRGLLSPVGQFDVGVTQLVKEGVRAGL